MPNRSTDMARIEALPDGGLRIGAQARMSDVAADAEVRRRFPVIAESLLFAASGQLRNFMGFASRWLLSAEKVGTPRLFSANY